MGQLRATVFSTSVRHSLTDVTLRRRARKVGNLSYDGSGGAPLVGGGNLADRPVVAQRDEQFRKLVETGQAAGIAPQASGRNASLHAVGSRGRIVQVPDGPLGAGWARICR